MGCGVARILAKGGHVAGLGSAQTPLIAPSVLRNNYCVNHSLRQTVGQLDHQQHLDPTRFQGCGHDLSQVHLGLRHALGQPTMQSRSSIWSMCRGWILGVGPPSAWSAHRAKATLFR